MALDFYDLNDKNRTSPIFQLEENDLLIIEPSLTKLKNQTGLNIDPYGRTKMHLDYVKLLLSLLELNAKDTYTKESNYPTVIKEIIFFLRKVINANLSLLIIGD